VSLRTFRSSIGCPAPQFNMKLRVTMPTLFKTENRRLSPESSSSQLR
jgi:hypothetical protein